MTVCPALCPTPNPQQCDLAVACPLLLRARAQLNRHPLFFRSAAVIAPELATCLTGLAAATTVSSELSASLSTQLSTANSQLTVMREFIAPLRNTNLTALAALNLTQIQTVRIAPRPLPIPPLMPHPRSLIKEYGTSRRVRYVTFSQLIVGDPMVRTSRLSHLVPQVVDNDIGEAAAEEACSARVKWVRFRGSDGLIYGQSGIANVRRVGTGK